MINLKLLEQLSRDAYRHCSSKGDADSPWQNPLAPDDCVSAFMMAKTLTEKRLFDHYVAVAPEGHVYGFFFEKFGAKVLSVFVDYPPRKLEMRDDLRVIRGGRVLILEDDVISGVTLQLVVKGLKHYEPRSLSLYLGRAKEDQQLENIPTEIEAVYLAEDHLDPGQREVYEAEFVRTFAGGSCGEP